MSEINMDKKIQIKNLAPWNVGFSRKDGIVHGDVSIAGYGVIKLTVSEVIAQSQSGNKLINGLDGLGSHATIYIDDRDTRVELGFETEDGKVEQKILKEDFVKKLFEYKTISTFEKHFLDSVVTRAEKFAIVEFARKLKLNDFDKVRIIENHTGMKV